MSRAGELARLLAARNAVLTGEFRLASGRKSRVYIDARLLLGDPIIFAKAVDLLDEAAPRGRHTILGVATAGIPWAAALAMRRGAPLGYVRPQPKGHGLGRQVEGSPPKGSTLLVDDVATTGGSLAQAAEAARREGYEVEYAVVLVDRQEGARERLAGLGVQLFSVATLREILEELGLQAKPG